MTEELFKWAVAGGGWILAIVTLLFNYLERRQTREEERLASTLNYFDGGSQKRSIGIALLEGLWFKKKRHHDVIVPLMANQIVYLLLSTDSHDPHQERNLVRLFHVFASIPNLKQKYHERWGDVADAIYRKLEGEKGGLPVSEATLKIWRDWLNVTQST